MKAVQDLTMQALIQRVADATSKHGDRVKLASLIGVSRQHFNAWLKGERSPDGETTLRLLAWVTSAECNKQNARRSDSSTAPGLTRSTQSKNEKRKTGPRRQ